MEKQISVPRSNMKELLAQATFEAQIEMNRTEIIELLGQESEKLHNSILNQR